MIAGQFKSTGRRQHLARERGQRSLLRDADRCNELAESALSAA
jgi:hypothetical protein